MQKASEVLPWIIILLLGSIDCLVYEELTGSHLHSSKENGQLDTVGKHSIHKRYLLTEDCFGERYRTGRCLYSYDCCGLPCIGASIPKVLQSSVLDVYNAARANTNSTRLQYTLMILRLAGSPITNDYHDFSAQFSPEDIFLYGSLGFGEFALPYDFPEQSDDFVHNISGSQYEWSEAHLITAVVKSSKTSFLNLGYCATYSCLETGERCNVSEHCCDGSFCNFSGKPFPICERISCVNVPLPCYQDGDCCTGNCSVDIAEVRPFIQNHLYYATHADAATSRMNNVPQIETLPVAFFSAALALSKSRISNSEAHQLIEKFLPIEEVYAIYREVSPMKSSRSVKPKQQVQYIQPFAPNFDENDFANLIILDVAAAAAPSQVTGTIDPIWSTSAFQKAVVSRAIVASSVANQSLALATLYLNRKSIRTCFPRPRKLNVWAIVVGVFITIASLIGGAIASNALTGYMQAKNIAKLAVTLTTGALGVGITGLTNTINAVALGAITKDGTLGKDAAYGALGTLGVASDNGEIIG